MVNQKTLIGLVVATVAIVVVAYAVQHSRKPVSDFSEQAGALVADLGEHLNDVSRLVVTSANKKVEVTLDNRNGKWVVAEKGGYPADRGKLRGYLLKVASASLIEKKTAKPDRYTDLGVSDISDPKAKGIAIELGGLKEPVSFIAGIFNAQSGGTFIRRSDEAQSWLATGNLIADKDPASWLDKQLANIPSDRIGSVTITHADGQVLRVFKDKPSDPHYTIADLPKGREPSSEFAANGLASVLADLKIDDVASSKDVPVPDKVSTVRYVTFDGVIVEARAWQVGDKQYVSMRALEDKQQAQQFVDAELAKPAAMVEVDESETASKNVDATAPSSEKGAKPAVEPARDRTQRLAMISTEIENLNRAFDGWSFILPGYKISDINKTMDELLKPLETDPAKAKLETGK